MGLNIMSIFHYSDKVKIYTYNSLEEAEHHLSLNLKNAWKDKLRSLSRILEIKVLNFNEHTEYCFLIIAAGFAGLIILRQIFHEFVSSLIYLYILLIALSAFWFQVRGGVSAALVSTLIFVAEISMFDSWPNRDVVMHTMTMRFIIYFFTGIVIGHQSATEKKLRKKIAFLSAHDDLTGFLNYRFSMEFLKKEFNLCKRHNKNLTIAILDIDEDSGKNKISAFLGDNDRLGKISDIINSGLRDTDVAGIYGGDEFLLIFPESSSDQAVKVLKRIRSALSEVKLPPEKETVMTFCAGLSYFSRDEESVNDLINAAEKALYQAKEKGPDNIVVYGNSE